MPERSGVSQRGNAWKSREFVGEEINVQYPHKMVFEVYGEDKLNSFNLHSNDIVKVYFDIDAREYNGRWYNSVRAWKVEHCDAQGNVIVQQSAPAQSAPAQQQSPKYDNDPF